MSHREHFKRLFEMFSMTHISKSKDTTSLRMGPAGIEPATYQL